MDFWGFWIDSRLGNVKICGNGFSYIFSRVLEVTDEKLDKVTSCLVGWLATKNNTTLENDGPSFTIFANKSDLNLREILNDL